MELNNFSLKIKLLALIFCFGVSSAYSQTLFKPEPAANPNLGGSSPWTAACASTDFNEYYVNFSWETPLVNTDNSFILELSDATGSFATPVQLANVSDENIPMAGGMYFDFALPTDTRGEGYKFRVRSTSPALTSPESDAFSMYYMNFNSSIQLLKDGSSSIPSGGGYEICNGNNIVLVANNVTNRDTYQYIWTRSSTVLSERGATLTINQAGMYNVEVDYGANCSGSANTLSNTIEITLGSSIGIAINPPAKTALCSGETQSLQSSVTGMGLTYTWYKDGIAITSPTVDNDSYDVDASVVGFEGDYEVEIYGTGVCLERSAPINITNAGDFTVSVQGSTDVILIPGNTETLSITTTAGSPLYQWYKDGVQITGETNNTIDVTAVGVYHAEVTQSGGACTSSTKSSEAITVVSPASFEIIIDYAASYTSCVNTDIVLEVVTINAITAGGSTIDVTADNMSSFTYQWKKDGVAISEQTSNNISLTDFSENGNYTVDAVLSSFTTSSNTLAVQLLVAETLSITSDGTILCDSASNLTLSSTTDLSSASYGWYKDGASFDTSNASISVNSPGTYQLRIDRNGCSLPSNEIIIAPNDPSRIVLDSDDNIIIPEGTSRSVRASGGTDYTWLDSQNNTISTTDTASFTTAGDYVLNADIDNCTVTRALTVSYLETFKVPNVVTVNGDGVNDLWVLPNSYSNDANISVIIYNEKGVEVLNQTNYANNWPQSSMAFSKQNMLFYYSIKEGSTILKQGTITIIR